MSLQARYTILRKIADGGTAEIFLATQNGVHGFEKVVVLKRIFPAYYADPQFRDMLVNEAHIAMSFNHSNIVQVLDLGEDDGQYILALELVDGWTLDAVIRRVRAARSSFPPALALYVTAEVCRALAYAHAKTDADGKPLGIVHRDISPHNVLLSEQGEVKLTDFGIATAHAQHDQGGEKVIRGKIAYMSPEQAAGAPLDARTDLFSVGTMLYVMICGRYPFDAPTDLEVLLLVKNGEAVPPEVARPGIHPEVSQLLKRAMAKEPADRFQRADDMLLEVERVMRAAFRAVGQTELKRWLHDLSARDGVPPLTKAPALPSSTPAGRVVGPATPTAATPTRIPPPPAVTRSGTTALRPPPPPAALSVGRKTGHLSAVGAPSGLPPRGRPPLPPGRPTTDDDAPILDAPTPLPETPSRGISLLPNEDSGPQSFDGEPTRPGDTSPSQPIPTSPAEPADAAAVPRPTLNNLSARLAAGPRTPAPVVAPVFPQGPVVPPPPVSPEILASIGSESGPAAGRAASSSPVGVERAPTAPPAPRAPGRGRALLWTSASVAALLVIGGSIRTCAWHRHAQTGSRSPAETVTVPAPKAVEGGETGVTGQPVAAAPDGGSAAAGTSGTTATAAASGVGGSTAPAEAIAAKGPGGSTPVAEATTGSAGAGAPATAEAPTPRPAANAADAAAEKAPRVAEGTEPAPTQAKPPSDEPAGAPAAPEGEPPDAAVESKKVSVAVTSMPPGARLTTAHHDYGTTPARIHLRTGNTYALTFKLDGYRPLTKRIEITDEPDQEITVTLRKSSAAAPAKGPETPAPPPPPPPPPPKTDKSWWQKMFSR